MANLHAAIERTLANPQSGSQFSMEYTAVAGTRIGRIPEWETRFTLDGQGHATLFRRRGPGDTGTIPPGRFSGTISRSGLSTFLETLSRSGVQDYRSDAPGPRDPVNTLRLNLSGKLFQFVWGVSRKPMPESMAELKRNLYEWIIHGCPNPIWSLYLKVHSLEFNQGQLTASLMLENQGVQSIHFAHPGSPGLGSRFGIHLAYGEPQMPVEGITPDPIEEIEIPLPIAPLEHPELLELSPARPFPIEFVSSIPGSAPQGWVGGFNFLHYLPEDTLAGIPVFNGAIFSEEIKW